MEKHRKTARELSDMILMKLAVAGIRVDVHSDTVGWHVVVYGSTPERCPGPCVGGYRPWAQTRLARYRDDPPLASPALAPIDRHMTARKSRTHQRPS
jgi:hypothetical protein